MTGKTCASIAHRAGRSGAASSSGIRDSCRLKRVGDPVERLVRDGLALVAAPLEEDRVGVLGHQLTGEAPRRVRLSDAGLAADEHRRERSAHRCVERGPELGQLGAPPHERRRIGGGAHVRRPAPRARARERAGESAERLRGARPGGGIEAEHLHAQRVQVVRDAEGDRRRRNGLAGLLREEDLQLRAVDRELPGEELVEHHPDRVEIRGRPDLARRRLLRRHVRGGTDDDVSGRAMIRRGFRDEPEVEHDDPSGPRDEDVRRLDVAMHLVHRVERGQPFEQLPERVAELHLVERRNRCGRCELGGGTVFSPAPVDEPALRGALVEVRADRAREGRSRRAVADVAHEVHAVEKLHREKPLIVFEEELVERDEVRVDEPLQRPELALEAGKRVAVEAVQRLQRDGGAPVGVVRFVDDPHPPFAEAAPDREARGLRSVHGRRRSR